MHTPARLLTTSETAEALGVSRISVWRWWSEDRGPVRPVAIAGRQLLYDPADVAAVAALEVDDVA